MNDFRSFPTLLRLVFASFLVSAFTIAAMPYGDGAERIVINGHSQFGRFGTNVVFLTNGNFVVTDPSYEPPGSSSTANRGGVFLYDGRTLQLISFIQGERDQAAIGTVTALANGNFLVGGKVWSEANNAFMNGVKFCSGIDGCGPVMSATNSLVGNSAADNLGARIWALPNGNYIVASWSWANGAVLNAGAVTFCSGTTGCEGVVSAANSLVGSNPGDTVGGTSDPLDRGIVVLSNGDYVVSNHRWNSSRGAVTWGSGTTGVAGVVSAENSLVGDALNQSVGYAGAGRKGVVPLSDGGYVVGTIAWQGTRGAATRCPALGGCTGTISPDNSLVGGAAGHNVGAVINPLKDGRYVVASPQWDSSSLQDAGAVTVCGENCTGVVSEANSLIGTSVNSNAGSGGVTVLPNGNFLIASPNWNFARGAVTFVSASGSPVGPIDAVNSTTGLVGNDRIGTFPPLITANGDYVVYSRYWGFEKGAARLCNSTSGCSGEMTAANSLVGTAVGDWVGHTVIALTNGNYVVGSPDWNSSRGAATFCGGLLGCVGQISAANSLVGEFPNDKVSGYEYNMFALPNGNYVIASKYWNDERGAVTLGNGISGTTGMVSQANSLVGTNIDDQIGNFGVYVLSSGDYVVVSSAWNGPSANRVGAVTYRSATQFSGDAVSAVNSLVGSDWNDIVGFDGNATYSRQGIVPLSGGGYVFRSPFWNDGQRADAGAITFTFQDVPLTGPVTTGNSVIGPFAASSIQNFFYVADPVNRQIAVSEVDRNRITIIRGPVAAGKTAAFDFDGDGKSDVSVFRPDAGEWWYLRSSDGGNRAYQFGAGTDAIAPADFTGDGKTDVAFWRPSTGEWYILRSEDGTFYSFPFGAPGDVPSPADYDGDGKADAAVFRPSSSTWFVNRSSDGQTSIIAFGTSGDKPVPADYDGDGKADVAIYRPNGTSGGEWWYLRSSDGANRAFAFGASGDQTVPADYTGDGKADIAFFRPSIGAWFILRSEDSSFYSFPWGTTGDLPTPGDYDGDGKADAAVFRPLNASWYAFRSTGGPLITQFGTTGDRPAPNAYVR